MTPSPPSLALLGGPEPWPLAGHVRGQLTGPTASVSWVGRVGARRGPEAAWRLSRTLDTALSRPDAPSGGRRRVLSVLWSRIEALPIDGELVLLVASRDPQGVALSAVGLRALYGATADRSLRLWLRRPHPLLADPDPDGAAPGALVVDDVPPWLVGVAADSVLRGGGALDGASLDRVFPQCGVHG